MLLQSAAQQILDAIDLEDCEQNFLASVDLQMERADGDLSSFDIAVDRNLVDFFRTTVDVSHSRRP